MDKSTKQPVLQRKLKIWYTRYVLFRKEKFDAVRELSHPLILQSLFQQIFENGLWKGIFYFCAQLIPHSHTSIWETTFSIRGSKARYSEIRVSITERPWTVFGQWWWPLVPSLAFRIVEADAFYNIRCKLFFKKGQEWKELGVGMLYLKPLNSKTQLLVRMETAGGNILLNIMLQPKMPFSRIGKNNVSMVSVPNPPVFAKPNDGDNSKPVTYLIRVKGATEADDLLKTINDKKGAEWEVTCCF